MRTTNNLTERRIAAIWGLYGLEHKRVYSRVLETADEIRRLEGYKVSWEDCLAMAIDKHKEDILAL